MIRFSERLKELRIEKQLSQTAHIKSYLVITSQMITIGGQENLEKNQSLHSIEIMMLKKVNIHLNLLKLKLLRHLTLSLEKFKQLSLRNVSIRYVMAVERVLLDMVS